ncbi:hypothetical protein U1Q18_049442 [Sarracenia purpurea var. burkii]
MPNRTAKIEALQKISETFPNRKNSRKTRMMNNTDVTDPGVNTGNEEHSPRTQSEGGTPNQNQNSNLNLNHLHSSTNKDASSHSSLHSDEDEEMRSQYSENDKPPPSANAQKSSISTLTTDELNRYFEERLNRETEAHRQLVQQAHDVAIEAQSRADSAITLANEAKDIANESHSLATANKIQILANNNQGETLTKDLSNLRAVLVGYIKETDDKQSLIQSTINTKISLNKQSIAILENQSATLTTRVDTMDSAMRKLQRSSGGCSGGGTVVNNYNEKITIKHLREQKIVFSTDQIFFPHAFVQKFESALPSEDENANIADRSICHWFRGLIDATGGPAWVEENAKVDNFETLKESFYEEFWAPEQQEKAFKTFVNLSIHGDDEDRELLRQMVKWIEQLSVATQIPISKVIRTAKDKLPLETQMKLSDENIASAKNFIKRLKELTKIRINPEKPKPLRAAKPQTVTLPPQQKFLTYAPKTTSGGFVPKGTFGQNTRPVYKKPDDTKKNESSHNNAPNAISTNSGLTPAQNKIPERPKFEKQPRKEIPVMITDLADDPDLQDLEESDDYVFEESPVDDDEGND